MASKYYKSTKLSITGVLEIEDGKLSIDVEDVGPISVMDALADFVGGEVTINVSSRDEF